ncbi:mitochondrial carrier protein [Ditylenchus destructor]|nr:mitochondrial carrier protein [Ditylenchus destructor]
MTSPGDTSFELEAERKLLVIEWNHLDLWKFYPMALSSSWTVRGLLYPMSVVKSRLQLQKQNNVYTGMRHAFFEIVKNEGFGALYRGFWVTMPQITASFMYSSVYEKLRNMLTSHTQINSPPSVSALAGGCASCCTQLVFVPTDIVAQYMMVYNNPDAFTGGKSTNAAIINHLKQDQLEKRWTLGLRVIRAVYKVDGILGFYRGFLSSLMLYIPSSMMFWCTYYNVLGLAKELQKKYRANNRGSSQSYNDSTEHPKNLLILQAISGACGGVCAAIVTNPLEMLRIRIQVHRTSYYTTMRRLVKYEGFHVFTKGLAPRMISSCIYSSLIMIGYETVKRWSVLPEYRNSIVW